MASPAVQHLYRYASASTLSGGARPRLSLVTSDGPGGSSTDTADSPWFFSGRLTRPKVAATMLLTQGLVTRSRFALPPAMLARIIAAADPVITADGEGLRLESFSACCGVYARSDLGGGALDGEHGRRGTTNVDFNPPLRSALTKTSASGSELALSVGAGELEVQSGGERIVEKRVPLPLRWIKGFVEVQAYQARMTPRFEISGGAEVRRFVQGLPKQATKGAFYLRPLGRGVRLGQVAARGSVRVGAPERLRLLESMVRYAEGLRVHAAELPEAQQACAFELLLPGDARFHLVLSAEVWRGFSGEGQALETLASSAPRGLEARLRAALRWQAQLDTEALAGELGAKAAALREALTRLGARGLVGYDLGSQRYFHRELPFDLSLLSKLQPRLTAARKLVDAGAVAALPREPGAPQVVEVTSGSTRYRVRLFDGSPSVGDRGAGGSDGGARCTCPWFSKHRGERGPCKHVLAAQIALESQESR